MLLCAILSLTNIRVIVVLMNFNKSVLSKMNGKKTAFNRVVATIAFTLQKKITLHFLFLQGWV